MHNIRNYAEYRKGDWSIRTYDDFFMGEWFGNEELLFKGKMIMHATLSKGARKPEELPGRLEKLIETYKMLISENQKGG